MIPSRAQVLVVVIRNEPQVIQAKRRNDTGDRIRHREEGCGQPGILPGGAPGDDERISRQLNRPFAWEEARGGGWPALPGLVALNSLPPYLVTKVDVGEQKWTATRPLACSRIQSYPKIAVYSQHLRQRGRAAFADHFSRLHNEPLVEFVNEIETRPARPGRRHE